MTHQSLHESRSNRTEPRNELARSTGRSNDRDVKGNHAEIDAHLNDGPGAQWVAQLQAVVNGDASLQEPVQRVQIEKGFLKLLVWDTDWSNLKKAAAIKGFGLRPANRKFVLEKLGEDGGVEALADIDKINDPLWAEANDKQTLAPVDTGGVMPQGKAPGSGTQTLHMNYYRPSVDSTSDTELAHLRFFAEQAADLGLQLMVTTTTMGRPDVEKVLVDHPDLDARIAIASSNLSKWAEDSTEFLSNRRLAVLTKFEDRHLEEGMVKGRQKRWGDLFDTELSSQDVQESIPLGLLVNADRTGKLREDMAGDTFGSPAAHLRAYAEGGNLITGKDSNEKDVVLIGKDSVAATARAYKVDEQEVRKIIAEDFGLQPNQILFVEQPGQFHLDMGLQLLDQGRVLVNDSEQVWRQADPGRKELGLPKKIARQKVLEDQAAKDLGQGGMTVIRKPFAGENFNFFNGEFVRGRDGKEYFLTNGALNEEQEKMVRDYYVKELGLVEDVRFSPRMAARASLGDKGGVGCRLKGGFCLPTLQDEDDWDFGDVRGSLGPGKHVTKLTFGRDREDSLRLQVTEDTLQAIRDIVSDQGLGKKYADAAVVTFQKGLPWSSKKALKAAFRSALPEDREGVAEELAEYIAETYTD